MERRCNNRAAQCRAGHFYGYVKKGNVKLLEPDCLKKEYLVTSCQTAFAIDYLWDMTLQILFSNATFDGLANVFNNLHFTNFLHDIMKRRETIISKRIAEAFYLYAFIELGQRYSIPLIISSTLDEAILETKVNFQFIL